jgi:predicted nucleotidyltransferase component of viral defense system
LSPREPRDLAASVRQRLLNRAKERGDDFQLVLTWYGIERLLYRLSTSPHADAFILKGAMLFSLWSGEAHRPTRDLDLLGFGDARVSRMQEVMREVCQVPCDDGLEFDPASVRGEEIRSPDEYDGIRIKLVGRLAGARVPLQVDIGFGDAVVPPPETIDYPSLLDLPPPRLRAYPREVVVAEKLQALVQLGMANTRMKDFYDLWMLARQFDFEGERLAQAIAATFERRRTPIPAEAPLALTSEFHGDAAKETQWRAFLRRGSVAEAAELATVVELIAAFVMPPAAAAGVADAFAGRWQKGGPWKRGLR